MKHLRNLTRLEIVNLIIAIEGITMILCSSLITVNQDCSFSKWLNIIGDLGIGFFPTGIIGLTLERIQNRNKEQENRDKRLNILRLFNNGIHGYLNFICNSVIMSKKELKNKGVFELISIANCEKIEISSCDEEIRALTIIVERLQELFGSPNPLYIITDIFKPIEINHFEMLLKDGNTLINAIIQGGNVSENRMRFISYLQTTCSEITECNSFCKMISNGDNIYIPYN